MKWPEARALAKQGVHVRRAGWSGKWIIYWRGIAWLVTGAESRVVEAGDWTAAEFRATDWTTVPNALEPCPPLVGACCTGGNCAILPVEACLALGGTYHGDGTTCSPGLCTQPPGTGACCSGGSCSETTRAGCAANGGTYYGDGSRCASISCAEPPKGACCVNGMCSVLTWAGCAAAGGTYYGDGSNCASGLCLAPPRTGACCIGGDCQILTEATCLAAGGEYFGDGTGCSAGLFGGPDATGACCISGNCSIKTRSECIAAGGTYMGDNTACTPETCGTIIIPPPHPPPPPPDCEEPTLSVEATIYCKEDTGETCLAVEVSASGGSGTWSIRFSALGQDKSLGLIVGGGGTLGDEFCGFDCMGQESVRVTVTATGFGECGGKTITAYAEAACEGCVRGCTNPHAANYAPLATEDDGSCLTCASQGLCVVPDPDEGANCNNAGNGCCDEYCHTAQDCSPSFDTGFVATNGTYYPSCYG